MVYFAIFLSLSNSEYPLYNCQLTAAAATGMASLYSLVLVVSAWVWRIKNEREGDAEQEGEESPSKHLIV